MNSAPRQKPEMRSARRTEFIPFPRSIRARNAIGRGEMELSFHDRPPESVGAGLDLTLLLEALPS
jgi:hypothetical protein